MPKRANRPISVREGTSIREEATVEKYGDNGFRSATWSNTLRAFLTWYNGYRSAHRVFKSPDGERVRAPLTNSHQPNYGDKYYARIKALERQITAEYDDLHVAMLTLSGSSRNGSGGWRCPADHLRDVVNSFRPDEGRGVYHALYDSLSGKEWEYALVAEHHKTGYGHIHIAIFVDGAIDESDFHPAIDAHLRVCDIAHRDAHDYYSPDPDNRPISVRRVDTDLSPEEYEQYEDVGNLGSYIGEYIGSYGEELFDRNVDELIFRASCWATGTQMVRFSTGANELIDREFDAEESDVEAVAIPNPSFDPETDATPETDEKPVEIVNEGWSLEGIGRVDRDGETIFDIQRSAVQYQKIEGAEHLDPPNYQPSDRPVCRTTDAHLNTFR
ncbi:Putative rep protein [Halorubrum vacuolatum]|uniref:Putative rep protein n=2 Tax=Halorubrum vacuolatum TaxID=63740 RepID=A0A238VVP7_HALVU|nr:Putative rep protein [Halorubrum vacuolatum]